MAKVNDTISLVKKDQKKVVKKTKQIQKKIKEGGIVIQEKVVVRKPKNIPLYKKRGLIYIGHIPHGFYEIELRKYFSQFGKVTNVKVCRSVKTQKSKGYAFIEFLHPDVAKIAAETMNNYLMFKKRITAEFVPAEKRPPYLFHGRRKKILPVRVTMRRKRLRANAIVDDTKQEQRTKRRLSRLGKKVAKLKKIGINTDFLPINVPECKEKKVQTLATPPSVKKTKTLAKSPTVAVKETKASIKKAKSMSNVPIVSTTKKLLKSSKSEHVNTNAKSPKKSGKTTKSVKSDTISKPSSKKAMKTIKLTKVSINSSIPKLTKSSPKMKNVNTKRKEQNKKSLVTIKKKKSKKLALDTNAVKRVAKELVKKKSISLLSGGKTRSNKLVKKIK